MEILKALHSKSVPLKASGLLEGRISLRKGVAHGARVSPWAVSPGVDQGIACPTIGSGQGDFFLSSPTHLLDEDTTYIPCGDLFLLGYLNSRIGRAYLKETAPIAWGDNHRVGVKYLASFPVPNQVEPYCSLVRLSIAKAVESALNHEGVHARYFQLLAEGLLCEFLVPDSFRLHGKVVAAYLEDLNWDRPASVIFNEVYESHHPIAVSLFFLDSVPEVRELIERL